MVSIYSTARMDELSAEDAKLKEWKRALPLSNYRQGRRKVVWQSKIREEQREHAQVGVSLYS